MSRAYDFVDGDIYTVVTKVIIVFLRSCFLHETQIYKVYFNFTVDDSAVYT